MSIDVKVMMKMAHTWYIPTPFFGWILHIFIRPIWHIALNLVIFHQCCLKLLLESPL